MTAPLGPAWPAGHPVGRRQLRRLSRRWSRVGVSVRPARLEQIAAGADPTPAELVDIAFADLAIATQHEQRHAKHVRRQRRCLQGVMVVVATVVALNALLCVGLAFFLIATHGAPF